MRTLPPPSIVSVSRLRLAFSSPGRSPARPRSHPITINFQISNMVLSTARALFFFFSFYYRIECDCRYHCARSIIMPHPCIRYSCVVCTPSGVGIVWSRFAMLLPFVRNLVHKMCRCVVPPRARAHTHFRLSPIGGSHSAIPLHIFNHSASPSA